MTQGDQLLQQLQRYDNDKRGYQYQIPNDTLDDELLNSQVELMQLTKSPGTIVYNNNNNNNNINIISHKPYTSLCILAREPRYVPPLNFGVVEAGLYRCGHPQSINYTFLESLKLKTIVYVGDKTNNWDYYSWIKGQQEQDDERNGNGNGNNLQFIHLPLNTKDLLSAANTLDKLLSIILNNDNYPLLLHSNRGRHRVGVVVAAMRSHLQNWTLSAVYAEQAHYNGSSSQRGNDTAEMSLVEAYYEYNNNNNRKFNLCEDDRRIPKFIKIK